MNSASCGVVLIGDFTSTNPTDAAVASLISLLSWKAARHRIDALNNDPYISLFGKHMTTPNIAGHRQVGQTLCPGRIVNLLPDIRSQVAANAGRWPAVTIDVPAVIRYEPPNQASGSTSSSSGGSGSGSSSSSSSSSNGSASSTGSSSSRGSGADAPSELLIPVPLGIGTSGDAVRGVQRALNNAGFDVGADGAFGAQTQSALVRYQRAHGLARTGQADLATVSSLGLVDSARSNVIVLPLRAGARGAAVRSVQSALAARQLSITIDGDFGATTRSAVAQFQKSKRLTASGDVDLRTAGALGIIAASGPTAASTSRAGTTANALVLPVTSGMTGASVMAVQRALRAAGYVVIVDGAFGAVTGLRVRQFQRAKGLPETGEVHERTAAALGLV
jgi:peptidoglycan hydrolase-like protein with peptidoglycan-binding domain